MNAMMMDNALTDRPQFYTDLSGLKSISRAGRENTAEGLRQVAEQCS